MHPSHFLSYSTSKIRSLGSKDHNHRFWCACLWKTHFSVRLHFYQLRVSHLPTSWRHKQTFLGEDSTTHSTVKRLFSEWNIQHQFKIWISVITNANSSYCICRKRKRNIIGKCIQQGHWEDSTTISFIPSSTENSNMCKVQSFWRRQLESITFFYPLLGDYGPSQKHYFPSHRICCNNIQLPQLSSSLLDMLPENFAPTLTSSEVFMCWIATGWKIEKKFRLAKAFHQYES